MSGSAGAGALLRALAVGLLLTLAPGPITAQWTGDVSVVGRRYGSGPPRAHAWETDLSARVDRVFAEGRSHLLTFSAFGRIDPERRSRSLIDLRDLAWEYRSEAWESTIGFRIVNWGVAESVSVVDVVNQLDLGEDGAAVARLGQPMVNVRIFALPGRLDLYVLAWFRERELAGRGGRLWTATPIGSTREPDQRFDGALRWSHIVGNVDVAVSHFFGTSREPRFEEASGPGGEPVLDVLYDEIDQTGLDAQWTLDDWLFKAEILRRWAPGENHVEAALGAEFAPTTYLSFFAEYAYDGRGTLAATSMERDVFLGVRLLTQDWTFTGRSFVDVRSGNVVASTVLSRRLGDALRADLDARLFSGDESDEPRFAYRLDDYLALRLSYFF